MEFEYDGIYFCTIVQNVYLLFYHIYRDYHKIYSLVVSVIQNLIFSDYYCKTFIPELKGSADHVTFIHLKVSD